MTGIKQPLPGNNTSMDNINEITKEGVIIQNCATGYHNYNQDNAMITAIDGRIVMALRCANCGVENTQVIPGLAGMAGIENIENRQSMALESAIETVASTDAPRVDFPKVFGDQMEQSRIDAPPWAEKVTERYIKDKTLDNFWDNIKKR